MGDKTVFASYPSVVVYDNADGKKAVQHLLWGDWMKLKDGRSGDYVEVRARGVNGWVHKENIQEERLLEIVFVDIGQGDGCLLVTPDDKHMVIDAGEGDNMARFLNWRYGGFDNPWEFECAVISHPDSDHYKGFSNIFDKTNITFKTIYHNGIMERTGNDRLGPKTTSGIPRFLTDIIQNQSQLEQFLSKETNWKRKLYPTMLKKAIDNGACTNFKMLCVEDGYMEGYGPDRELTIKVLGPVVKRDKQNKPQLQWLKSVSKTKNGHSVVLRLQYRDISLMLGGDLNIPAEELLLSYHTGLPCPAPDHEAHQVLVEAAREVFQVDIAKSCHHGSSDFSTTFLSALNPIATVISSGDNEPHSHPRSDTLGTIGAHSRGVRSLIFSTELARSASEAIKHPYILRREFLAIKEDIEALEKQAEDTEKWRKKKEALDKKYQKMVNGLERSIAIYGAINVRTDGHKVVIAQKLEKPRSKSKKWDIYRLEAHGTGPLTYQSKH
jgi:beta-lactamase superfamily II metal-dependent hydrolase